MKKRTIPIFTILFALVTVAFLVLTQTQAGVVRRVAADFRNFGGVADESFTDAGVPGISIWTETVIVKPGEKVMYITLSATGDTHGGAAAWFSCNVDPDAGGPLAAAFCNPGSGGAAGAPGGWIALNKMPAPSSGGCNAGVGDGGGGAGDCHDNRVYYTWCTVIKPPPNGSASQTVQLRMATSVPDVTAAHRVFIEAAHFYIDLQQGSASGTTTPSCIQGAP